MSKSVTAGIIGSVLGIVATVIGIFWIIQYYTFSSMYQQAMAIQNLFFILYDYTIVVGLFQNLALSSALSSFMFVTFILALLLVLTLILMGVGLYGLGKIEGKSMGTVSLVFGVIGAILALILLLAGAATGGTTHNLTSIYLITHFSDIIGLTPIWTLAFLVVMGGVPAVNGVFLWLGLIAVGSTLIIFGATFVNLREGLDSPGLSVATGVLSIIAGIFLFMGVLAPWLAFIILFVGLIMSALVFYGSRQMS
ncbi:MAG: hypothetical protein WED07_13275 [Candidatus Freyarchaeum deiterrae]